MKASDLIVGGEMILTGDVIPDGWAWFYDDDERYIAPGMVREALATMEGPVTVRINSMGGVVHAGEEIRATLANHDAPVTMIVEGIAASSGSLILMAAKRREMSAGSLLMIHDPSGVAFGTEADMRKGAEAIGVLAETVAGVYAAASGKSATECRQIMKEETWYGPADAVAAGFAHAVVVAPAMSAGGAAPYPDQATAQAAVMKAHAALAARIEAAMRGKPPADEAQKENGSMPNQTPADEAAKMTADATAAAKMAAEQAVAAERERVKAIRTMTAPYLASGMLTQAQIDALTDDGKVTAEMAATKVLEQMASATSTQRAHITADANDKMAEGMRRALYARTGLSGGERNEFGSMGLREMARETLRAKGIRPAGNTMEMVGQSFTMTGSGGHSTSDFTHILADVANKSMLKGWEEAEETYEQWTSKISLPDFKTANMVGLTSMATPGLVVEGGEFPFVTLGNFREQMALATYGERFVITRQTIINDDLNAFSMIPMRMGRACRRRIGDLAYAVLTANAAMGDGTALFHSSHGNLAASGGVPSELTVNAAITAMAIQKDRSATAVALNIAPKFLLAPVALRSVVLQTLNSEYAPDDTAKAGSTKQPYAYNTVRSAATPIFDARLTGTAWFMAADPNQFDTVAIGYLDGNESPFIDQQDGWKVDGTEFKVRIDAVAKATAWEGLYRNPGA